MADTLTPNAALAGRFTPIQQGQQAFVPDPLPRSLELDSPLVYLLDEASRTVAMLAGIGETLANPQLLIRPFLHREAVLSSRIEGTQASLSDLFAFEAAGERVTVPDAREVANYIGALDLGLSLLDQLPLCVRLTNQVHARLLQSVRGENRRPGELRTVQNYIGAPGTPIEDARYIPPPPLLVRDMLSDWEQFLNDDLGMPPLIQCALMHYQFEAIHPYVDGNGRVGRLLIILFLCQRRVLPKPLLYLSAYFERNRAAYYDHLYKVSFSSDWRSWLAFFLRGVAEQAHDAIARSRRVRELHERYRTVLQDRRGSTNVLRLLDDLFVNPYMTAPRAHEKLGVSREAARRIIERFVDAGILTYVAGAWPRIYVARELLGVIDAPVAAEL